MLLSSCLALLLATPAQAAVSEAEAPSAASLASARARVQALVAGPDNRLAAFRPSIGVDEENALRRNVPAVRVASPWQAEERLWIRVPENAWTHLVGAPEKRRLLFAGEDPATSEKQWGARPFPATGASAWQPRADGGLELESALAGGITVAFQVLPGERMFELRFGVTNSSATPLLETWCQFCAAFPAFASLRDQAPSSCALSVGGKLLDWGGAGQDLAWLEALRDPATDRIVRGAFFRALVSGCTDARFPPERYQAANQMWLRETIDAPLVVKSSLDRARHVVLYSPCARTAMYNAISPCAHVDPILDGVGAGETRWVVWYGLFHEGELAPLVRGLVELDRGLRRSHGFPPG